MKTFVFEKHGWDNPPTTVEPEAASLEAIGRYLSIDGEYCMAVAAACNTDGEDGLIVRTTAGRIVFVEMQELMESRHYKGSMVAC